MLVTIFKYLLEKETRAKITCFLLVRTPTRSGQILLTDYLDGSLHRIGMPMLGAYCTRIIVRWIEFSRLCCSRQLYMLFWRERNSRRHGGACVSVEAMSRAIDKVVCNRISLLKYTGCHRLQGLLRRWFEVNHT